MDPLIFRKGDAENCLVVDTTWNNVLSKPAFFTDVANRIIQIVKSAEERNPKLLTKSSTLMDLKKAINSVLLNHLRDPWDKNEVKTKGDNTILVDAFWDEIKPDSKVVEQEDWEYLKEAIQRICDLQERLTQNQALTEKSTLMETKENFNNAVLKPLLNINEEE